MGKKSGSNEAAMARADEQARQQKIREGTTRVEDIFSKNFNDDFFAGRQKSYLDYATPQLDTQFEDARKQLTFALDRSGTMDSSIRAQKEAELQRKYDLNRQSIADEALSNATKSRTAVEDARTNLIQTLNATGDAEGAANSALARSQALSQPGAFNPLTSLFADFTQGLGTQAALERSYAMGSSVAPRYQTGLFGSRSSVKTTG